MMLGPRLRATGLSRAIQASLGSQLRDIRTSIVIMDAKETWTPGAKKTNSADNHVRSGNGGGPKSSSGVQGVRGGRPRPQGQRQGQSTGGRGQRGGPGGRGGGGRGQRRPQGQQGGRGNNQGSFRSGGGPRFGGTGGPKRQGGDGRGGPKKWVKGGKEGRRGRDRDRMGRSDFSGDNVPEAIQALLYDHEFFKANAMKGKSLNTRDMDGVDAWFADSFIESGKTEASEFRTVLDDDSRRRTHVPRSRGAEELFHSMYEQINNFDPAVNEELGGDFAANLNETLQRNVYYSEDEKSYMMSMASSLSVKHMEAARALAAQAEEAAGKNPENMYDGVDMVFSPKFRKGPAGMEAEKKFKAAATMVQNTVDYEQEETDWDATAVVDEDEL